MQICPTFSSFLFNSDAVQDFTVDEGVNREDYYFNQIEEYSDVDDDFGDFGVAPPVQMLDFDRNDDFGDHPDLNNDEMDDGHLNNEFNDGGMSGSQLPSKQVEQNVLKMVASTSVGQDANMFKYFDNIPGQSWAGPEFWKSRSLKGKPELW